MNRSHIMKAAWEIARRRRAVYAESLREALRAGLSSAWWRAKEDIAVKAAVAVKREQAEHIARTMTRREIATELRDLGYAPHHRERIELLQWAEVMTREATE